MRGAPLSIVLACLTTPAPAAVGDYRAVGTEPFWSLTIDPRSMRLEEPGQPPLTVAKPAARPSVNGERYVAREMTVDVTHVRCSDGMSDRTYRDTVTVQVGRRILKGCGGGTIARSRLADTRWRVWQVNGRPVRTDQPLTVNFTGDRIEGKLCNGFGGRYRLNGERLRAEPIVATRMLCQGPVMAVENTLFTMLRGPVTAKVSRWNTLTLSGRRTTVTLRPVRR